VIESETNVGKNKIVKTDEAKRYLTLIFKKKNCKITHYSLPDLQLALSGIKMNSKIYDICQKKKKKNLLPIVKFCPLN
jgi:hypothetical protein